MSTTTGLLSRLLGFLAGAAFLALAFVFSLMIFVVLLALAVVAMLWFWWRTRALRRQQGAVIIESAEHHEVHEERPALEGESRRVDELPPRQ